jgi:hypothetical protein
MKPTKCVACQGETFFTGRLGTGVYPETNVFPGIPLRIKSAVCLSCGFINAFGASE